jgi:hypothetical protein
VYRRYVVIELSIHVHPYIDSSCPSETPDTKTKKKISPAGKSVLLANWQHRPKHEREIAKNKEGTWELEICYHTKSGHSAGKFWLAQCNSGVPLLPRIKWATGICLVCQVTEGKGVGKWRAWPAALLEQLPTWDRVARPEGTKHEAAAGSVRGVRWRWVLPRTCSYGQVFKGL